MFCKNCGAKLLDDAKFCTNCGQTTDGTQTNVSAPVGRKETLVVESSKEREQKTITNYQKLGWTLTNNQEVNITSVSGGGSTVNGNGSSVVTSSTKTYIKLTFERNTGMKNYAELDASYKKYKVLEDEYRAKEIAISKKGFSMTIAIILGLATFIFFMWYAKTMTLGMFELSFDGIGIFIFVLFGGLGVLSGWMGGYIGAESRRKKLRRKQSHVFSELDAKMEAVLSEAEIYL